MEKFIIELYAYDNDILCVWGYVFDYSNCYGRIRQTKDIGMAKKFDSERDALVWAGGYVIGHNYKVIPYSQIGGSI